MKTEIPESDMLLLIPDWDKVFYIEESSIYQKLGEGIRTVEYIQLSKKGSLQFVEAKKTCPNVNNKDNNEKKKQKYESYYQELTEKYSDSLNVLVAGLLDRYDETEEIGKRIKEIKSLRNTRIQFILVIKTAEELWLSGVKTELEQRLRKLRKIWHVEVVVLNEELAIRLQLAKGK